MGTITLEAVRTAAKTLAGIAHVTPVITSSQLDLISGARVFLKCESFQRTGAFKFRGAYHAIGTYTSSHPRQTAHGVVTLSSGNHAQGVALSCRLLGLSAHIVMPQPTNPVKRAAAVQYGARIYGAADRATAEPVLNELLGNLGGHYVHPFNDPLVIAGQGTCMLEFLEAVPDLEIVLAPVGGGGLLSGICVASHSLKPSIQVYACEPVGALDTKQSVQENRIVPMDHPKTVAEGLRTSLGDRTLPILREHLADVFSVEEEELIQAMRFAFERLKIVIEPSSAVALAPLLRKERLLEGRRVGVVVTGGNVELSAFM